MSNYLFVFLSTKRPIPAQNPLLSFHTSTCYHYPVTLCGGLHIAIETIHGCPQFAPLELFGCPHTMIPIIMNFIENHLRRDVMALRDIVGSIYKARPIIFVKQDAISAAKYVSHPFIF